MHQPCDICCIALRQQSEFGGVVGLEGFQEIEFDDDLAGGGASRISMRPEPTFLLPFQA